jgi:hypothetical protein
MQLVPHIESYPTTITITTIVKKQTINNWCRDPCSFEVVDDQCEKTNEEQGACFVDVTSGKETVDFAWWLDAG